MSEKNDRVSGQVENRVRELFIVQQQSGQAWFDLHPYWKNKNEAISHMNDCLAQMNRKFRVIKRTDEKVA